MLRFAGENEIITFVGVSHILLLKEKCFVIGGKKCSDAFETEEKEEVASEEGADFWESRLFASWAVFLLQHDICIIITIIAIITDFEEGIDGPNTIKISAVNSSRQDVWDTYVELRAIWDVTQEVLENFTSG
jgi:hypothetical protein